MVSRDIKFRAWDGSKMYHRIPVYSAYLDSFFKDQGYGALMQYTGLKDKNGVEIYEGDVVEIQHPAWIERCEIVFRECCFTLSQLRPGPFGERTLVRMSTLELREQWKLEVIGNIYENRELLNQ